MLSLGVLLYSFFPGPQHFVHGVYYLLRYFVTEDVKPDLEYTNLDVGYRRDGETCGCAW